MHKKYYRINTNFSSLIFTIILFLSTLIGTDNLNAATRYSVANGNWNATSTWSASSGGASGASVPVPADDVVIEGNRTVTVTASTFCTNISVSSGSTLALGNLQLTVSGNFTNNGSFTVGTGTITMNGAGKTIGGTTATSFYNLEISNVDGINLANNISVSNTLTLTGGRLTLGAYNLTMGASANAVAGTLGATNMIVANDAGEMRKLFTTNGSYVFPVGDNTATAEYSPATVNFASGTYAGGAYASAKVTDDKHPDNANTNNYLTRYWTVGQSGITAFSATVTGTFPAADIVGDVANMITGRLNGALPFLKHSAVSATTISASALTDLGQFTGISNPVTVSTTSLSGFMYTLGAGPSVEQSFTVTGAGLSGNITITPPSDFEISTTTGGAFSATNPITLAHTAGVVNTTTIYVRLKAGLSVGAYSTENITITSSDAISINVACGESVVNSPAVIAAPTTIPLFSYTVGTGPSVEQTFSVNGSSLAGNITITPPSNFEISTTTGGAFSATNPIVLVQSGGTVNATTIYVRMKAGLSVSLITTENIVITSPSATTVNVACSGEIIPSITAAGGGNYCAGSTINLSSSGTGYANQYWKGPNNYYSLSANPSIASSTTTMSGTYTVVGSTLVGNNLLANGDFSNGYNNFTSAYTQSEVANIAEGYYAVVGNPHTVHSGFSACTDHTTNTLTSKQLVMNAATIAGVVVWSETVASISTNTDYQFTYWVQSVVGSNPSQLQLYINNAAAAPLFTAITATCQWSQFTYNWNSGAATSAIVSLVNQNTVAAGNDFALDDIVFQKVLTSSSSVEVTVNSSQAVSVSIAATATSIYTGNSITFTATPTYGGTAPSYQWKLNGVNVGSNSATYTNAALTNSDKVTCVLTSNYPCISGGNPATSNEINMTVLARTNFWEGTNSTDWGTASNWSDNAVPASGDDIEYATVANNGTAAVNDLVLDIDRTVGAFINASSRNLIIPAGKSLTVNNIMTTDGNTDRIYIQSSSSGANGTLIFGQPTLNTNVNATVEMYSKAFYDLGAAAGSKYTWQFFGIPVKTMTPTPSLAGAYVRVLNEAGTTVSNHWTALTNASAMTSFVGYEITQSAAKTYVFPGTLETGNYSSGQMPYTTGALYAGQNLYANPYTAAINIASLSFGTQTEAAVYLYNSGTYNQWVTNLGVSTYDGTTTTPGQYTVSTPATAGFGGVPSQIPSMQAFLVKAMGSTPNATLGINYSSVVTKNTTQQRSPIYHAKQNIIKPYLKIQVSDNRLSDCVWIFIDDSCNSSFNNGWDGYKIKGNALAPQLYAVEQDGIYQIDATNNLNNIQLGFQSGNDSTFTLTITNQYLSSIYDGLYLVDLATQQTIEILGDTTNYAFTNLPSYTNENRFQIVTRLADNIITSNNKLQIHNTNQNVFIQNDSNESGWLSIHTLEGKTISKMKIAPKSVICLPAQLQTGLYIIKASTPSEYVSKRIVTTK